MQWEPKYTTLLIGAMTSAASTTAGYLLAVKRLKSVYETRASQEIAEARAYYSRLTKPESPVELARKKQEEREQEEFKTAIRNYRFPSVGEGKPVEESAPEPATVTNIFKQGESEEPWDYDREIANRSEEFPYIISRDEFLACESDYNQNTLTYYLEDDVLVDERDDRIENTDETVGDDNLTKFGHGSKDPNIVYIRNDKMAVEFEIVQSHGSYAKEVLGFIEHSATRKNRRFRSTDE